jgi:DNA-binding response OmpR family regulator
VKRILVLDDDPAMHEVLAAAISAVGCAVDTAHSADEALGRLRERAPDAVLVDLELPGDGGWAFVRAYQAQMRAQVPIGVMASTAREAAIAARTLGADAHLRKPFGLGSLLAALEHLLQLTPPELLRIRVPAPRRLARYACD